MTYPSVLALKRTVRPTFEEQEADPSALWRQVFSNGRDHAVLDGSDSSAYKQMLGEQYDTRVSRRRAQEDEDYQSQIGQPGSGERFQNLYGYGHRGREDAAMGPGGFNRDMVLLSEATRGTKVNWPKGRLYERPDATTQEGPFGRFGAGTGGIESQAPSLRALLKKVKGA